MKPAQLRHFVDIVCRQTQGLNLPTHPGQVPLRPLVIDENFKQEMIRVAKTTIALSNEAMNLWSQGEPLKLCETFGIPAEARKFMNDNSLAKSLIGTIARPDLLIHSDGLKILETNCHTALGGIPECEKMADIYLQQAHSTFPSVTSSLSSFSPIKAMGQYLLEIAKLLGLKRPPRVVLIEWDYDAEMNRTYASMLTELGIPSFYVHPDQLSEDQGYLTFEGVQFDIALRNVSLEAWNFQDDLKIVDGYLKGCEIGKTLILSDERASILSNKMIFAYLCENQSKFSPEKQSFIQRYLPWSQFIKEQKVRFDGQFVFLKDLLEPRHKNRFILKAGVGEGGSSVFAGHQQSESNWSHLVKNAFDNGGYIVQQYYEPEKVRLPYLSEENTVIFQTTPVIFGQYIIGDSEIDPLIRLDLKGDAGVINHAKGAIATVALTQKRFQ
jgi:hypothetical protein